MTPTSEERGPAQAVRELLHLLLRLLEVDDPGPLLAEAGPLRTALARWRRAVETGDGDEARLKLLGRLAGAENERDLVRSRNAELLEELLQLNQKLQASKQEQVELRMRAQSSHSDARRLDLEVRDLKRRLREREGGPPLSAIEAAPSSSEPRSPEPPPEAARAEPAMAELQEALRRTREAAAQRAGAARAALEALFAGPREVTEAAAEAEARPSRGRERQRAPTKSAEQPRRKKAAATRPRQSKQAKKPKKGGPARTKPRAAGKKRG